MPKNSAEFVLRWSALVCISSQFNQTRAIFFLTELYRNAVAAPGFRAKMSV